MDDLKHGHGKEHSPQSGSYKGQFSNGKRHGLGKLIAGIETYYGQFEDGQPSGFGTMKF